MTDSPSDIKDATANLPNTLTSAWVSQKVEEYAPGNLSTGEVKLFSLLLEQRLCSDATVAVLNRFSTASQRIKSLRKSKDYEYWNANA